MNAMSSASSFEFARTARKVWVCVVAKPFAELSAKQNLINQGFDVYLPMKLFEVSAGPRKGELRSTPFFPRYLFAHIDVREDRWRYIWSTIGVQSVLGATAARPPCGVADFVIERLQAQEEAGYIRMMGDIAERGRLVACPFGEGEIVRMAGSPLEAVFLEPVDAKRAIILVKLLGRDSRLTVDIAKLRATDGS